MTAYRVTVASRMELKEVTVVCDVCGTCVIVQVETANIPEGCPSCSKAYSEEAKSALAGLARFHRDASKAERKAGKAIFQFAIKEAESVGTSKVPR